MNNDNVRSFLVKSNNIVFAVLCCVFLGIAKQRRQQTGKFVVGLLAVFAANLTLAQEAVMSFDVPSQEASSALIVFGKQAKMTVLLSDTVRDIELKGVQGDYTIENAIDQLLRDTGLIYRFSDDAIIVSRTATEKTKHSFLSSFSAALLSLFGSNKDADKSNTGKQDSGTPFLDEIIVTARSTAVSKFESTVSINTVSDDKMARLVPRSAAEILRTIPGIRSESSSGEGNSNIAVRGVPVATGGSKFVQLQEDSMPIFQFGDIIVATADSFLRVDDSVDRVEVVKGSSSATMVSNAPAGVINFISKTGGDEIAGSIGVTTGIDYDDFRTEFGFSGPINNYWRFHLSGFYREGEGVREVDFKASRGGQFKANLTREFERGYIRFYLKYLNNKAPAYLPMPMNASQTSISGFDARTASNISSDLRAVFSVGPGGSIRSSHVDDGMLSKSTAHGLDIQVEVGDGVTIREKFRYAKNSGKFFGVFTEKIVGTNNIPGLSSILFEVDDTTGAVITDTGADGLAYLSGPDAGVLLTAAQLANLNDNGLLQTIRTFDNDLERLDNFTNDLSLTKTLGQMEITAGYYKASQIIDVNWFWQTFVQDVSNTPRLLNVFSGSRPLTQNGQLAYGTPGWGNCCARDTSIKTHIDAFYIAVQTDITAALTLDTSLRYDTGDAGGHYAYGRTVAMDVNGDGLIGAGAGQLAESHVTFVGFPNINASRFDYDWEYLSWSVAANYMFNDTTALFASSSKGGRVNVDRLGDVNGGRLLIEGETPENVIENELASYELGIKYDGMTLGAFATLFYVETRDFNSDIKDNGVPRDREYKSLGLEFEGVTRIGDFNLHGSLTWTDAEIVAANNSDLVGNTPRRQAEFVWSLSPGYHIGDHFVGATIIGTGDAYDQDENIYKMHDYAYMNIFADFALAKNLMLQLSINNITNELGITEKEAGSHFVNGQEYIRARSIAGRTSALKLKYTF